VPHDELGALSLSELQPKKSNEMRKKKAHAGEP
jgi:hypothetical protein